MLERYLNQLRDPQVRSLTRLRALYLAELFASYLLYILSV